MFPTHLYETIPSMALRITGLGEEIAAVTGLPWHLPLEEWPEDPALAEFMDKLRSSGSR